LNTYHSFKLLVDWKVFKGFFKKTKRTFFNEKIQEITLKNKKPWNIINWIKKHKLPAIEALQFNRWLCIKLDDLWQALHLTFNSAQDYQINLCLLDEISMKSILEWPPFSKEEFRDATVCSHQDLIIYLGDILKF